MSHYAVAVFHRKDQEIEELLAPYDEKIDVEPYIWKTRREAIDYARKYYKSAMDETDDECWEMMAEGRETDESGNIYSTYNPKSKWDWWTEGGRYSGCLTINGQEVDSGRVGDIDFGVDDDEYRYALDFWDSFVEKTKTDTNDEYHPMWKPEYYKERYKTRENYAKIQSQFLTYAVVTPDGEWHAPGKMGWFACSSESDEEWLDWCEHYKERFIDAANPDWYLTVVDCHI